MKVFLRELAVMVLSPLRRRFPGVAAGRVDTMNETWKDIPGYEGAYQVSDLGRVRGLDRVDNLGRKVRGRLTGNEVVSFDSVGAAARHRGVSIASISDALNWRSHSSAGYVWNYA